LVAEIPLVDCITASGPCETMLRGLPHDEDMERLVSAIAGALRLGLTPAIRPIALRSDSMHSAPRYSARATSSTSKHSMVSPTWMSW